jgi:hypothetical protein
MLLALALAFLTSVIAIPQPLPIPSDAMPTVTTAIFGMFPFTLLIKLMISQNLQEN